MVADQPVSENLKEYTSGMPSSTSQTNIKDAVTEYMALEEQRLTSRYSTALDFKSSRLRYHGGNCSGGRQKSIRRESDVLSFDEIDPSVFSQALCLRHINMARADIGLHKFPGTSADRQIETQIVG